MLRKEISWKGGSVSSLRAPGWATLGADTLEQNIWKLLQTISQKATKFSSPGANSTTVEQLKPLHGIANRPAAWWVDALWIKIERASF
jgi:hypothetical protein